MASRRIGMMLLIIDVTWEIFTLFTVLGSDRLPAGFSFLKDQKRNKKSFGKLMIPTAKDSNRVSIEQASIIRHFTNSPLKFRINANSAYYQPANFTPSEKCGSPVKLRAWRGPCGRKHNLTLIFGFFFIKKKKSPSGLRTKVYSYKYRIRLPQLGILPMAILHQLRNERCYGNERMN